MVIWMTEAMMESNQYSSRLKKTILILTHCPSHTDIPAILSIDGACHRFWVE
ncbi:hypothetical protein [Bacillus xiapuensis]|uniref:Uncharacterized protein n=1 Tax=Bacillus xiapuensis TaxID=2014075 RepID=A0ABU6N9V5_9BACI|nr:hypothetical protein [Bacillus xiapuensis]